ncbi:MAG: exosortase A [Pseudomonadota bacterium]
MSLSEAGPVWSNDQGTAARPLVWRRSLTWLGLAICLVAIVTFREWAEMVHQWWNIDTYTHILLVPLIGLWLVWLKTGELAKIEPRPWGPGLFVVAAALGLWLTGRVTGMNLVAHAGAVGALQGAILAVLGVRVGVLIALPVAYLAFLVPFGDEIIPPLQSITARLAIALTQVSGVPAVIDGIYIDTPAGLFIVAEECSGVKFLIAMVTLAVLVAFTRFESWRLRVAFLAASIVVPVLANGARAWGTIYIAQFAGIEFAAGFDHIFYGWVFFALVVACLLAGAWPFFEIEPEEYGLTAREVAERPWVARLERHGVSASVAVAAIAAMALCAGFAAALLAPYGLA